MLRTISSCPAVTRSVRFVKWHAPLRAEPERRLVALHKDDPVDPSILQFVNRLSDLFFKLCRQESHQKGLSEERWRRFGPNQSDSES